MWELKYDRAVPPLPEPVGSDHVWGCGEHAEDPLPLGCWMIHLEPLLADDLERKSSWMLYYRGHLRVSAATDLRPNATGVLASGDLYVEQEPWYEKDGPRDAPPPVPRWPLVFPRAKYRFYVRMSGLEVRTRRTLALELDTYRLDPTTGDWSAYGRLRGKVKSRRSSLWPVRYLEGELENERGTPVAKLRLGWLRPMLRSATVEIDSTAGRQPLPSRASGYRGETLESTFADYGWEVKVDADYDVVPAPATGVWTKDDADKLHAAMLTWREKVDFDSEWRYHVLIVDRLANSLTGNYGAMYDMEATDSNLIPREGLAIAGGTSFPEKPIYGCVAGKKLEDVPELYLRTAIHELGHTMGLSHNYATREFMQGTNYIAEDPTGNFPHNVLWRFNREDVVRLKHLPDPWVRPGGIPFELNNARLPVPLEDITSDASDKFAFVATALVAAFPLGAPVRIHLRLQNGAEELPGPSSISLGGGCVDGVVDGPGGTSHRFSSAMLLNGGDWEVMAPHAVMEEDIALVRGPRGSLFASPGAYEVRVQVSWPAPAGIARITATVPVLITWPSAADQCAALAVLTSPEIVVPLIFRSNPAVMAASDRARLDSGLEALALALQAPGLRPHWAAIEARYRSTTSPQDPAAVAAVLQDRVVITAAELEHIVDYLNEARLAAPVEAPVARMLQVLATAVAELTPPGLCPKAIADKVTALLAKLRVAA